MKLAQIVFLVCKYVLLMARFIIYFLVHVTKFNQNCLNYSKPKLKI